MSCVRTTAVESTGFCHRIPNRAARYRGRMPPADGSADGSADGWWDGFDRAVLDTSVWLPHYLPAWSSRAGSAAALDVTNGSLVLDIPVDHPVWCPGDHEPPLRASGLQTGSHSGPVGSTVGQQPFREDQTVREEQPRFEGLLVDGGRVEIRCRADLSDRSMASLWLGGPATAGRHRPAAHLRRHLGPGHGGVHGRRGGGTTLPAAAGVPAAADARGLRLPGVVDR